MEYPEKSEESSSSRVDFARRKICLLQLIRVAAVITWKNKGHKKNAGTKGSHT